MEQLMETILEAAQAAGIPTARALQPGRMPRLEGPVAALALRKAVQTPAGFGGYLGVYTDAQGQTRDLYGMRLEAEVVFTIYTPRASTASAGETMAERLAELLLEGIDGVSLRQFTVQETTYAAEPDCFTTVLEATVLAHLYAVTSGEEPAFTDFILKGEIV